jgi:hypothetical protein
MSATTDHHHDGDGRSEWHEFTKAIAQAGLGDVVIHTKQARHKREERTHSTKHHSSNSTNTNTHTQHRNWT